ncbi:50S ribosomal protein L3 N(5)-glutamine methyltransferase [Alteromonas sp. KUL49]|uniref:50S ribosomal protein L3 N(5)-glutamine methyltransferase n=1 Tax=Alteromonas sp. KUL49 TaxID=2480798 RepID=UPI00102F247D|nr:50S ribosomal protein L3 N(5)-glutamine methyltransferase [Alteromonas sp. KUL49]TAP41382.1 50S ribosomal protein L3 N(5)-glutamine methyltransferase [Alteromonas sp. KUL49]GEA10455.1 50S ribosomal protein L3 glutamine methyltransferase [Alteromonas sp. KUL49]
MTDKFYLEEAIDDLHTILDMVRWAASRFNDAALYFGHGTDNAWDEGMSLVSQALHLPHSLIADSSQGISAAKLTRSEREKIAELVLKRVQTRMPLPYITNEAWFCGFPFYVDERVLIPRSPFAELIQKQFSAFITEPPKAILDMCTGGGCIAIALAHTFDEATVDAVDISADALEVADFNIQEHQLSHRVYPIESDLFSSLTGQKYDLIVSNPPYVDAEDMADLPDEYHHEPELALAAGNDGLDLVDIMLREAPNYLAEQGWLFVEVGNSEVHMATRFPGLDVTWIAFEHGGQGIFAVQRATLVAYFENKD